MRIFQNLGIYPAYFPILHALVHTNDTFDEQISIFLNDRYCASHVLEPILTSDSEAFFTNGDDVLLQKTWARENGLPRKATLEDILLAQIESHNTEILYNIDPVRYGNSFLNKLPGCVRKTIAWRALPSTRTNFSKYDLIVCNFPGIIDSYRKQGINAEYFYPSHDPVMDKYAKNIERPVDVLFVGGYSRHHKRRAKVLELLASYNNELNIVFHLNQSRLTKLAESRLGTLLPLAKYKRPKVIQAVSAPPLFGRALYSALASAKIVLNGAIDIAGPDRGNMRCFEAMGCGALMVSDIGNYPKGMVQNETMLTYSDENDALDVISSVLADTERLHKIASNGYNQMIDIYSKKNQWSDFVDLVSKI